MKWANEIAAKHEDKRGILVTHEFIDQESTLFSDDGLPRRTVAKTKNSPHSYGIGKGGDVHGGEELWQAFVSKHLGIGFVLNGHYKPFERVKPGSDELRWVAGPAISRRTDHYPDGRPVHQMLFNTQWSPRGGEGWLLLLEFLPDGKTVKAWSISPYLERTKGVAAGWPVTPEMRFTLELSAVEVR